MMKNKQFLKEYDREMLRAGVFSVFWSVIRDRKTQNQKFRFSELAAALGVGKSVVSKWFTDPDRQNCELNTVSDIAHELGIELQIEAVDKKNGKRYGPHGLINFNRPASNSTATRALNGVIRQDRTYSNV